MVSSFTQCWWRWFTAILSSDESGFPGFDIVVMAMLNAGESERVLCVVAAEHVH